MLSRSLARSLAGWLGNKLCYVMLCYVIYVCMYVCKESLFWDLVCSGVERSRKKREKRNERYEKEFF